MLKEFRNFPNYDEINVGDELKVDLFAEGEKVVVTGISKGKGFQGVMKRHGFGGVGMTSHGQSDRQRHPGSIGQSSYPSRVIKGQKDRLRAPGSIGQSSYPSRVFKGTRMGGRTGNTKTSVKNLKIAKIIPDENLILVEGAVPGSVNSLIEINK